MIDENKLMSMAESLPVDLKARLIDRLLKSLQPSMADIDDLWSAEAERRIGEIESGAVKAIPGEDVFKEVHARFSK